MSTSLEGVNLAEVGNRRLHQEYSKLIDAAEEEMTDLEININEMGLTLKRFARLLDPDFRVARHDSYLRRDRMKCVHLKPVYECRFCAYCMPSSRWCKHGKLKIECNKIQCIMESIDNAQEEQDEEFLKPIREMLQVLPSVVNKSKKTKEQLAFFADKQKVQAEKLRRMKRWHDHHQVDSEQLAYHARLKKEHEKELMLDPVGPKEYTPSSKRTQEHVEECRRNNTLAVNRVNRESYKRHKEMVRERNKDLKFDGLPTAPPVYKTDRDTYKRPPSKRSREEVKIREQARMIDMKKRVDSLFSNIKSQNTLVSSVSPASFPMEIDTGAGESAMDVDAGAGVGGVGEVMAEAEFQRNNIEVVLGEDVGDLTRELQMEEEDSD